MNPMDWVQYPNHRLPRKIDLKYHEDSITFSRNRLKWDLIVSCMGARLHRVVEEGTLQRHPTQQEDPRPHQLA